MTKLNALNQKTIRDLTENLLPFWMTKAVDNTYGGFYGAVTYDGKPVPQADKHIVLNCRLVWTFAAAYRLFKNKEYLTMANRAYRYFNDFFRDKENGGAYQELTYDGKPKNTNKFVYGLAFSIYAASEYYRATQDQEALNYAIETMELLEKHAYDPVNKGYFEVLTKDWCYEGFLASNVNPIQSSTKTMNTHLHLIEAYTNLLRVYRNEFMEAKVKEHLEVMLEHIVDKSTGHYLMFFADDWAPVVKDISPGHDIEGSWLMIEAAEVLGDEKLYNYTKEICVQIAHANLEYIDSDGAMLYHHESESGHIDRQKSWWVQNECVVGYINAWQMTNDEYYLDTALKCYDFTESNLIDHVNGGWFTGTKSDGKTVERYAHKASGWVCPYHNARMCYEIYERAEKMNELNKG